MKNNTHKISTKQFVILAKVGRWSPKGEIHLENLYRFPNRLRIYLAEMPSILGAGMTVVGLFCRGLIYQTRISGGVGLPRPPCREAGRVLLAMTAFLILSSIIFHPASVHAAGYGLSIYPPLLRVHIKPGKTITQVFKIDNLMSDEKFFIARLVPFTDADLFGNPILNLKSTASWLTYLSLTNSHIKLGEPFTIKGRSSEQLILSLTVPENATLKDLYATLLVSTYSNTGGPNYQGTQVSATTGSNLLITIASEAYPPTLLRVENITPTSGWLFKFGGYYLADSITPVNFSAQVNNRGDFATETKGIFKVAGRKAEPVYLEGLLPVNVLAKTKRTLQNNHGENFVFAPNLGNIGPHRVTISIKTDNANAENSITIIFLPLKVSFGLFFASLFLIAIYQTTNTKKDSLDNGKSQ